MKRIVFVGVLCLIGCTEARVAVPDGEWGGKNVELQVDAQGAALSFKCGAKGVVPQPLSLDQSGRFDLAGTFDPVVVAGGPRPARYAGSISGKAMHLALTVDGQEAGSYDLVEGAPASFDVCNFN